MAGNRELLRTIKDFQPDPSGVHIMIVSAARACSP
jgi:hypothetical protein